MCSADRAEAGPDFVPGLPHVVAHSSQVFHQKEGLAAISAIQFGEES